MTELTKAELAERNQLIVHSEALLRARGMVRDGIGFYDSGMFRVSYRRDGSTEDLQVDHRDETVMRCQWLHSGDPGYGFLAPGPWQRDFLKLVAAHS